MSMKYDFTTILNREGTGAIAVSKIPFDNAEIKEGFSKIPMWVADMNYATAPSVIEAIQNRLAHPVFGYFDIKDAYSESIIEWQKTRNGVTDIPKEAIDYENCCKIILHAHLFVSPFFLFFPQIIPICTFPAFLLKSPHVFCLQLTQILGASFLSLREARCLMQSYQSDAV